MDEEEREQVEGVIGKAVRTAEEEWKCARVGKNMKEGGLPVDQESGGVMSKKRTKMICHIICGMRGEVQNRVWEYWKKH